MIQKLSKKFGYRSKFSHKYETAEPGFYSVFLKDYDISAEITATGHVGIHRYEYLEKNSQNVIIFDNSYTLDPNAC